MTTGDLGDTDRIDLQSIVKHADQHYESYDSLWMMRIRRNIVLVRVSGKWSVEDTAIYLKRYWDIFNELRRTYAKHSWVNTDMHVVLNCTRRHV